MSQDKWTISCESNQLLAPSWPGTNPGANKNSRSGEIQSSLGKSSLIFFSPAKPAASCPFNKTAGHDLRSSVLGKICQIETCLLWGRLAVASSGRVVQKQPPRPLQAGSTHGVHELRERQQHSRLAVVGHMLHHHLRGQCGGSKAAIERKLNCGGQVSMQLYLHGFKRVIDVSQSI